MATMERQRGRGNVAIDYRHVIWSLVRKPGAFSRYRYREALFPTLTFRRTYDTLWSGWAAPLMSRKDTMITAAAIDRVVHHSVILELTIDSYRARVAKKRARGQAVGCQFCGKSAKIATFPQSKK